MSHAYNKGFSYVIFPIRIIVPCIQLLFSTLIKKCSQPKKWKIFQTKKDFITYSKLIINELGGSPIRSDNFYFANNEQASLAFFIVHAEHKLIKLKLYNNCSAQAVNNISEWPMWYLSKSVKFAYLWKERNQLTLNKAHVIEIKAKNSLIVWCREKRVNWKKTEDGGNLFFKALVNRFWLTSWKLFMVQQSCSWTIFYQMDFMKRQWYVYLK